MMDTKKRFIRTIEKYLNKIKKEQVELYYGKGTSVKIKQLEYITQGKHIMVEAVIILGDTINEDVLDRGLVDYLLQDILCVMFPDEPAKVLLSWDV